MPHGGLVRADSGPKGKGGKPSRARYGGTAGTRPTLPSPKQPSSKHKRDWYPYYAGFPEAFVQAVLKTHLRQATFVLDPWSGSGTTTAACLKNGIHSVGVDINPAMTVIARARLTPITARHRLAWFAPRILDAARHSSSRYLRRDLLHDWIQPAAALKVRGIQAAIHKILAPSHNLPTPHSIYATCGTLPTIACFFYCVLFSVVRQCLARFRSTNPMWFTKPPSPRHRIRPSSTALTEAFHASFRLLLDRLTFRSGPSPPSIRPFRAGSAKRLRFCQGYFDAALTSPPYATRLDYVSGSLPELALLGADDPLLSYLRRQTAGSPVVSGPRSRTDSPILSSCASRLLRDIASHPSKGSLRYYLPWMRNYLVDLQAGLSEIHRTVDSRGVVCVVVQDSYYKERRIALQRIATEIMASHGRILVFRHDYDAHNPRLRSHPVLPMGSNTRRQTTETVLVFQQP